MTRHGGLDYNSPEYRAVEDAAEIADYSRRGTAMDLAIDDYLTKLHAICAARTAAEGRKPQPVNPNVQIARIRRAASAARASKASRNRYGRVA
ncbi:hypothetical protein [Nocardia thailandica]|uniref:hypothetical protein n=1 Tax=Nocardia thailandica TaxID=257275 RepID=UPI00030F7ED5|nr:hypothetical protein [Nocardia thailandica]